MSDEFLKVTCWLATPIVGDVPFLDSIIEYEMAQREGKAFKIRRDQPCPPYGDVHIPMARRRIGGVLVPCCSGPICSPARESVEHFAKRLGVEHSGLLAAERRRIVPIGNAVFKSYRLPFRMRVVDRIVWFCAGTRRHVLKLLKSVASVGKKRSYGYGLVDRWEAERVEQDWSWFAPGNVLMRPLPACSELPADIAGSRQDFGACQSPYWHPDRYREIVVPC